MNKRVLIPTDFSKNALNAIRYALKLYEAQDCDFYFLNAYQVGGYSIDSMLVPEPGERAFEAAKKESANGFSKLFNVLRLQDENPKHTYHTISTFNSLLYAIKTTIAKKDIDIVVMGTKGATGSEDVIFGTNAVEAMEKVTECPVLAIPGNVRFEAPKEIVFPTDFKTNYKRRELNYLIEIAKQHGTVIRVLHIAKSPDLKREQSTNKDLLDTILSQAEHTFHTLRDLGVQAGISAFIESRESDMIAFVNRKHSFFGSLLSRPLVKEMGYYSKIPVLALNDLT